MAFISTCLAPSSSLEAQYTYQTSLPALHVTDTTLFRAPEKCLDDFYKDDLDVSRLNQIHDWLWLAGRPEPARPLHRQMMLRRSLIITEQADLHLVWDGSHIFIKPLPGYFLFPEFWEMTERSDNLRETALGFLRSYSWLIRYPSDFKIALEHRLIPENLKWPQWRRMMAVSLESPQAISDPSQVNKRYCYGELRQGRLNQIYRISQGSLIRGYEFGYNHYGGIFSRNFGWIISVFAYFSIALAAFQVGLGSGRGKESSFQDAAYGFGVFSIVVPLILSLIVIVIFLILLVHNLLHTRNVYKRQKAAKYLT